MVKVSVYHEESGAETEVSSTLAVSASRKTSLPISPAGRFELRVENNPELITALSSELPKEVCVEQLAIGRQEERLRAVGPQATTSCREHRRLEELVGRVARSIRQGEKETSWRALARASVLSDCLAVALYLGPRLGRQRLGNVHCPSASRFDLEEGGGVGQADWRGAGR